MDKSDSIKQLLRENFAQYRAKDLVLVNKLQKLPILEDIDILNILTAWHSQKETKQPLLNFLVESKIFSADALKLLTGKNKLKTTVLNDLICESGIRLLKKIVDTQAGIESTEGSSDIDKNSGRRDNSVKPLLPEANLNFGKRIGKCSISEEIGKGGFCTVYKGFHETLKIPVAVKVFLPHPNLRDEQFRQRFASEAQTLAKLNHRYIVRVLDFDDLPYSHMVLEYVDGGSLADLINKNGRVDKNRCTYLMYQTAVALAVAHSHGVIHRDIKPENILIAKKGEAKLADLGMAYILSTAMETKEMAKSKILEGTPAYIAPEQAFSPDSADLRSDIYSLGATFFHALTGRYPFEAESPFTMVIKHSKEPLTPPHEIVEDIPIEISKLIQKMMAKKPEDRYQKAEKILPDLLPFFLESGYFTSDAADDSNIISFDDGSVTQVILKMAKKMIRDREKA